MYFSNDRINLSDRQLSCPWFPCITNLTPFIVVVPSLLWFSRVISFYSLCREVEHGSILKQQIYCSVNEIIEEFERRKRQGDGLKVPSLTSCWKLGGVLLGSFLGDSLSSNDIGANRSHW